MLAPGDVQGGLRSLEALLRGIKYPGQVDYSGLSKGDPSAFLPIVSFALTSFSPPVAQQLMAAGLELTGKTDLRFTDALYKVLRDIFHYRPVLNKQQFLQWGFSQRKLSLVCDVINLVLQRHKQLKKPRPRGRASPGGGGEAAPGRPVTALLHEVVPRPLVVSHVETPPASLVSSSHAEALLSSDSSVPVFPSAPESCCSAPQVEERLSAVEERLSAVEERLSAVEARLDGVASSLGRLSHLEGRVTDAERTEAAGGVVVSRATWDNLMSRLTLLETQLELSRQSRFSSASVQEEVKDSLERISGMLRTTSSLLRSSAS